MKSLAFAASQAESASSAAAAAAKRSPHMTPHRRDPDRQVMQQPSHPWGMYAPGLHWSAHGQQATGEYQQMQHQHMHRDAGGHAGVAGGVNQHGVMMAMRGDHDPHQDPPPHGMMQMMPAGGYYYATPSPASAGMPQQYPMQGPVGGSPHQHQHDPQTGAAYHPSMPMYAMTGQGAMYLSPQMNSEQTGAPHGHMMYTQHQSAAQQQMQARDMQRAARGGSKKRAKPKKCMCCSKTETPLWRDIPSTHRNGGLPLCNGCGLRYQKYTNICDKCFYVPMKNELSSSTCMRCSEKLTRTTQPTNTAPSSAAPSTSKKRPLESAEAAARDGSVSRSTASVEASPGTTTAGTAATSSDAPPLPPSASPRSASATSVVSDDGPPPAKVARGEWGGEREDATGLAYVSSFVWRRLDGGSSLRDVLEEFRIPQSMWPRDVDIGGAGGGVKSVKMEPPITDTPTPDEGSATATPAAPDEAGAAAPSSDQTTHAPKAAEAAPSPSTAAAPSPKPSKADVLAVAHTIVAWLHDESLGSTAPAAPPAEGERGDMGTVHIRPYDGKTPLQYIKTHSDGGGTPWDPTAAGFKVTLNVELDVSTVPCSESAGGTREDVSHVIVLDNLFGEDENSEFESLIVGPQWDDRAGPCPEMWEESTCDAEGLPPSWGVKNALLTRLLDSDCKATVEVQTRLAQLYPEYDIAHVNPVAVGCGAGASPHVVNAAVHGGDYQWHIDADPRMLDGYAYPNREPGKPYFVTLLLYINSGWPRNWDSETLFLDMESDTGIFVRPAKYRAILMDQDVTHRMTAPSKSAGGKPRYSIVWKLLFVPKSQDARVSIARAEWGRPIRLSSQ